MAAAWQLGVEIQLAVGIESTDEIAAVLAGAGAVVA